MAAIDIAKGSKSRSRSNSRRRGILGIESAIVMIAFVVVAAALAFVVLNAGFGTTQKSKTTISEGLASATGAVEVAGIVTGKKETFNDQSNNSKTTLAYYSIPIKLASGANAVNLQKELTAVRYFSNTIKYDNIYKGVVFNSTGNGSFGSVDEAFTASTCKLSDVNTGQYANESSETCAFIWFSNIVGDKNPILDGGEVAVLTIVFKALDNEATPDGKVNVHERPEQGDSLRVELVPAGASVLTVERVVPVLTTDVVNMG
ncbi:MAG: archaellin/type IV pilin N-terminal domain-containing protein [Candidatus Nitrosocaldus sp.]